MLLFCIDVTSPFSETCQSYPQNLYLTTPENTVYCSSE